MCNEKNIAAKQLTDMQSMCQSIFIVSLPYDVISPPETKDQDHRWAKEILIPTAKRTPWERGKKPAEAQGGKWNGDFWI